MKVKPALLLGCFLLATGCIEFSRQTMSYRYDTAADTLYIFQDYQGIFGANNTDHLEQDEIDQLDSVMKGGRTFFFNNWITEFNRANLEETLNKPKGEIDANEQYEQAVRNVAKLTLANIQVENMGFYKNNEGQLCGAQRVTIQQCSKIVTALNKLMPFVIRDQAAKEDRQEARQVMLKYAAGPEQFIQLDGNQLRVRIPVDAGSYKEFEGTALAQGLRATGGTFAFKEDVLLVEIGDRDAKRVSMTLPFSNKAYLPNAVAAAKGFGIKESFDAESAAVEFLAGNSNEKK